MHLSGEQSPKESAQDGTSRDAKEYLELTDVCRDAKSPIHGSKLELTMVERKRHLSVGGRLTER